ncbi:zinc finger protein 367 isoform X3 [Ambystoma mexicanum]|uniref:zinc finger protein 367 isoform X3 n=1 Tax=Ambystoma mexicanum TaxID=8296 RepID=UPI0037E8413F
MMTELPHFPQQSSAIFCHDSPKRVLVSVIRSAAATTPIKPKRSVDPPTSPGFSDFMVYPWRWGENAHNVTLSPGGAAARAPAGPASGQVSTASPCCSPEPYSRVSREEGGCADGEPAGSPDGASYKQDGTRRGRPRADTVRDLINEGENSSSRIRCNICNRVFPREKSLQAHKRTHTGCFSRFTHANRHCPKHPYARLKREEPTDDLSKSQAAENKAVAEWLSKYWETREQRTPTMKEKVDQQADQEQQDPMEYLQSDEEEEEKSAHRRLQEQRERLHGALALIELANLAGAQLRQ